MQARVDLEAALDALSPRARAVTVLKYVDDLTIASIAAVLKLNREPSSGTSPTRQ